MTVAAGLAFEHGFGGDHTGFKPSVVTGFHRDLTEQETARVGT